MKEREAVFFFVFHPLFLFFFPFLKVGRPVFFFMFFFCAFDYFILRESTLAISKENKKPYTRKEGQREVRARFEI